MEQNRKIKVIITKEVRAFLKTIPNVAQKKVIYNVDKVANGEIDKTLFKKLDDTDIWEFRTLYNGIAYRLLAFWDTESEALVVACNGFIKKTQKTPQKEIAKANEIRTNWFNSKNR